MTGPRAVRDVVVAGHLGDLDTVRAGLGDEDGRVRAAAISALERLGELHDEQLQVHLRDPDASVRRRAAEIAAAHPGVDLRHVLDDPDAAVVEAAAWACGEHGASGQVPPALLDRLVELTTAADDPLVREAGAAALGAIGDERGLSAILAACRDRPAVRRRAVLALAPFVNGERADHVDAALDAALEDRDWQVRQAAEDLRRAAPRGTE